MTGLWASPTTLWLAVAALGLAAMVSLALFLRPRPRIPIGRRRPEGSVAGGRLQSAALVTTSGVLRLLRGRSGSAWLEKAGIRTPLNELLILLTAAVLAAAATGLLVGGPAWSIAFALAVAGAALGWLRWLIRRRQAAFAAQLDETLRTLAGSLRAGFSLPQAVQTVSLEALSPTRDEFARVVNETRVGRPMVASLAEAATRVGSEDFYWVTQAVAINREVGGNLAEVLDGVGRTIRERGHLKQQVAALSVEGRLSALILVLLPVVVFGLIWLVNPSYVGLLLTDPLGRVLLALAGALLTAGVLWLRRTVRIEF